MSLRVSSSKGKSGSKKQGQKHQNTFAYTTNKHSFIAQKIAALPVHGLCARCLEIIQWRKRMNKYKPLTQPRKCVQCLQKTVRDAYHVLCNSCACDKKVCAKCQMNSQIPEEQVDVNREKIIEALSERQKRSFHRKMDSGREEEALLLLQNCSESCSDSDLE